ncbi:MAG: glutamate 5-kinase [Burkholderiaceae bacterium]
MRDSKLTVAEAAVDEVIQPRPLLQQAGRIVVKVGSSLVTNDGKGLDASAVSDWAAQIARLRDAGKEVVFVSSGAIAEGVLRLGMAQRPHQVHELQAAAAVGQMGLAQVYQSCFLEHGMQTAQVLLTHDDLSDRKRYLNARSTIQTLLALGVVPVVNENDTVVTDEIKFGDNDTLAALVANLIEADVLIILTDQEGLFTADPRKDSEAVLLGSVSASDPSLSKMAGQAGSSIGTGGMQTKVAAARRVAGSGAHTIVASGRQPSVLARLAAGELLGTQFISRLPRMAARKQWLAGHLKMRGAVVLDVGAVRAVLESGKSLLPIGCVNVHGEFERGEVVACLNDSGTEIARGLINYSSDQTRRILKTASHDISERLGFVEEPELIHRSNMVLMNQ